MASAYFYPRPPRGGRQAEFLGHEAGRVFLSTPSARRATLEMLMSAHPVTHFYPRPPRGGRLSTATRTISGQQYFYPRPPRGGRLHSAQRDACAFGISIHALREEGDCFFGFFLSLYLHFYPRPPRGGRPGGAWPLSYRSISIHALREEGDVRNRIDIAFPGNFYPRPPRGGRLTKLFGRSPAGIFLSTPSARRATRKCKRCGVAFSSFLSTPSARRATAKTEKNISAFVSL